MRYAVVLLLMIGGVFWWRQGCLTCPIQTDTLAVPQETVILPLLPEGQSMERITFEPNPVAPSMNSACPVDEHVVKDVARRNQDIGFLGEAGRRPWHDVEKRLLGGHASFEEWRHNIRHFLVLYTQLTSKSVPSNMGISEASDVLDDVKYALCDEIAIIHFLVEQGIDPTIGQEWEDTPKILVTKEERIILEILYRSCRMTAEHIIHQQAGRLARVTFAPTPEDWAAIQKAFDIDPRRGDEIICTYRPTN